MPHFSCKYLRVEFLAIGWWSAFNFVRNSQIVFKRGVLLCILTSNIKALVPPCHPISYYQSLVLQMSMKWFLFNSSGEWFSGLLACHIFWYVTVQLSCLFILARVIKCFIAVVHSLSHVRFFETPWTIACQASLSFILSRFMSIESMMSSNHLILCHPLLLLPSIFLSIRVFSNESVLHIRWSTYLLMIYKNTF